METEGTLDSMGSAVVSESAGDGVLIAAGDAAEEAPDRRVVDLPDGMELDSLAARRITAAAPTRVIVLAGPVSSGKTTLLTSVYERFARGPFAGFLFAGSQTLLGFEQRCHLSRVASFNRKPDTERTKNMLGEQVLHLKVRPCDLSRPARDILFTDLSGEAFELARDSTRECQRLDILQRADHFVLLIDGAKLVDPGKRHGALADAVAILRSCLDAEMLRDDVLVDVLVTKEDLFEGHEKGLIARNYVESRVRPKISSDFSGRVRSLRIACVAARPDAAGMEPAHGVEVLFPSWAEESPARTKRVRSSSLEPLSGRQFDMYSVPHVRETQK